MTTLYGIKNCDSVKKARQWLDKNRIDYHYHDLRNDGIDEAMVLAWLEQTSLEALINKRSTTWKSLDDVCKKTLNIENAAALCARHETLIKRPVLELDGTIYLGFDTTIYTQLFT